MSHALRAGTCLLLVALYGAPTALFAQSAGEPAGRERAPGVPMTPQPQALPPGIVARERAADPTLYETPRRHAENRPRPDLDPPMPRPVPSIIAP